MNEVRVFDALLRGGETLRIGQSLFRIEKSAPRHARISDKARFGRVVGASLVMRRLYPLCERLASSELPIVVEGETGTGKEQLARALHEHGPRSEHPFVVFDCTAVAPNLIESELFGHERGAFTGSVAMRKGVFERAHHGTLFIDEIGDMPLELQPKLLRALERAEIARVGGDPVSVDVRVIAATRRNLDLEVQKGRFRDDLFHRLVVTRIELPPLRERKGDVPLLAMEFCRELGASALPSELLRQWDDYAWPGNVRELRNAVARRIALGDLDDSGLGVDREAPPSPGLPALARRDDPFARVLARELPLAEARSEIVEAFETRYVEHMLDLHGGNVTRAAAAAGVGRRHMQRMKLRVRGE